VIREARREDAAALAALPLGHPLFERYGFEAAGTARSLIAAMEAGEGVLLAERDGRPVGFAWWVARGAFGRSPYLRLLVVDRAWSGGGIGGALLDAVEARAFAAAADLFLLVTDDNTAAQRFYARRGFAEVGRLPDYVRSGITEVVMRKRAPEKAA